MGGTQHRIKDLLRIINQMCSTLEKTRLTLFTSPCFLFSFFFPGLYVEYTVSAVLHKSFSRNLQKYLEIDTV